VGLETIRQDSGCNWLEATALCEARVSWCWGEPNCGFTAQIVQVGLVGARGNGTRLTGPDEEKGAVCSRSRGEQQQ
jgi:hypothetical protein